MSKTVARLLGVQETVMVEAIAKLEELAGYPGEDIRLVAELEAASSKEVAGLGLDPRDTRGRELYHGLLARYEMDNARLEASLGRKPKDSINKCLLRTVEFSAHAKMHRDIWVVKRSVAKDLLRAHPPRKLMKFLNYRSVDSMLKRADVSELYAGLSLVESSRWLNVFWKMHADLRGNQFETRKVEILAMRPDKWGRLAANAQVLSTAPQLGVVAMWPNKTAARMGVLGLSAWILQEVAALRSDNAFLKLQQFQPNFGELLVKNWHEGAAPAAKVGNLPVFWRSLQAHYGKSAVSEHPGILGPHVQPDDLYWDYASKALADLCGAGRWWAKTESLSVLYKSGPVSMNLLDVAANYARGNSYKRRRNGAFREAFKNELIHRYLMHPSVENLLLAQLEETAAQNELEQLFEVDFSHRARQHVKIA